MVKTLLEMSARITALEQQVLNLSEQIASLSSNSTNSSEPPSLDGPRVIKPKKRKSGRSENDFCKGLTSPFSSSSPEQYAVGGHTFMPVHYSNACCPRSRAHGRDLGRILKQELGIDSSVVPADAEEQMRPGGSARCADQADRFPLLDLFPRLHLDLG